MAKKKRLGIPRKGKRNWAIKPTGNLLEYYSAVLNMMPDLAYIIAFLDANFSDDEKGRELFVQFLKGLAERRRERGIASIMRASYLDSSLLCKDINLEHFSNITDSAKLKLSAPDWLKSGTQVVLVGKSGADKTQLAHVLSKLAIVELGYSVLHTRSSEILDEDNTHGGNSSPYEQCKYVDLLVIDDVGRSDAFEHSPRLLEELLVWRFDRKLPTIITMSKEMNATIERLNSQAGHSLVGNQNDLRDCFIKLMSKAYKIHMAPTKYYRYQARARSKEING